MHQEDYQFWVYILSNRSRSLYIGMTNNFRKRVMEHRNQTPGTYTARYNITRLVYCEQLQYVNDAIAREKELKKWKRAQKVTLIETTNPTWEDLMHDELESVFFKQIPYGNNKQNRTLLRNRVESFPLSFPKGICFVFTKSNRTITRHSS